MSTPTKRLIDANKQGAEVYHGDLICKEKIRSTFEEFSLPENLIPVDGIEEFGFNRSTGFMWLLTKKKKEHKFKKIGQVCIYDVEITGFIEKYHLAKLTGVKVKQLMIPVGISDILVGDPTPDMVKITTGVGLFRVHPVSDFLLESDVGENEEKVKG